MKNLILNANPFGTFLIVVSIIAVLVLVFAVTKIVKNKKQVVDNDPKDIEEEKEEQIYFRKKFLTTYEQKLYQMLLDNFDDNYYIYPQINLASIINKKSNTKYFAGELFRNIDFGIFDSDFNVLLLIELNDFSHKSIARKERDEKVRKILNNANIQLITIENDALNNNADAIIEEIEEALLS